MDTAFLGVIALGVIVMAVLQVGAVLSAARLARRLEAVVTRVEQDLAPVIEKLHTMSGEAARAATLAATQVERLDRSVTQLSGRFDAALDNIQTRVRRPAREGAALVAGLRAGVLALRELRRRRQGNGAGDDEDPLFIG